MQAARRIFAFLLVWLGLFGVVDAAAASWMAQVAEVSDGDSLKVKRRGRIVRVRLYGIDSPELAQPYGHAARKAVRDLLEGREVRVEPLYRDSYGREVALVYVNGTLANLDLVKGGSAWVYTRYCRERELCEAMRRAETAAKRARIGLWRDRNPEAPWQWRRKHPQANRR